jgi:hypothetical protein
MFEVTSRFRTPRGAPFNLRHCTCIKGSASNVICSVETTLYSPATLTLSFRDLGVQIVLKSDHSFAVLPVV